MKTISVKELQERILRVSDIVIAAEEELTEVDRVIGDGDHGVSMKIAFTKVKEKIGSKEYADCADLFEDVGLEIMKSTGGSSGLFFGLLFMEGKDLLKGKTEIDSKDLYTFFEAGIRKIVGIGHGKPGDKTMLDPLYEVLDSLKKSPNEDIESTLDEAYCAALHGVEETKKMISMQGRSKGFRDMTKDYPDPGAITISLIFKGLTKLKGE